MTDCPITFPVLAFTPGEEATPDIEGVVGVDREQELATGSAVVAEGWLAWTLVDSVGAQWKIAESNVVGRLSRTGRLLSALTRSKEEFLFEHRFIRLPKITLAEFKARVIAAMRGDPHYYLDDEVVAGEANEPFDEPEVLLEAICAEIQKARSFDGVIKAFHVDQFTLDVVKRKPEKLEDPNWRLKWLIILGLVVLAAIGIWLVLPDWGRELVIQGLQALGLIALGLFTAFLALPFAYSMLVHRFGRPKR